MTVITIFLTTPVPTCEWPPLRAEQIASSPAGHEYSVGGINRYSPGSPLPLAGVFILSRHCRSSEEIWHAEMFGSR